MIDLQSFRTIKKMVASVILRASSFIIFSLLLASGDIETNPGPIYRYPCSICGKPVMINQQGIACDRCEMWTHAKCCGVSKLEYDYLSTLDDSLPWFFPTCLLSELPFYTVDLLDDAGSVEVSYPIPDDSFFE